eukprot:g66307.t1
MGLRIFSSKVALKSSAGVDGFSERTSGIWKFGHDVELERQSDFATFYVQRHLFKPEYNQLRLQPLDPLNNTFYEVLENSSLSRKSKRSRVQAGLYSRCQGHSFSKPRILYLVQAGLYGFKHRYSKRGASELCGSIGTMPHWVNITIVFDYVKTYNFAVQQCPGIVRRIAMKVFMYDDAEAWRYRQPQAWRLLQLQPAYRNKWIMKNVGLRLTPYDITWHMDSAIVVCPGTEEAAYLISPRGRFVALLFFVISCLVWMYEVRGPSTKGDNQLVVGFGTSASIPSPRHFGAQYSGRWEQ